MLQRCCVCARVPVPHPAGPHPPPRPSSLQVRKMDRILLASDARIDIVTPVPGEIKPAAALVVEAQADV